MSVVYS